MRDNNIISILDVLLTETTLVTKANADSVRIWNRYHRGPYDNLLLQAFHAMYQQVGKGRQLQ